MHPHCRVNALKFDTLTKKHGGWVFQGENPLCGDSIHFYLRLSKKGVIHDLAWKGDGCVLSQAAASMLAEQLMGKSLKYALKISSEAFLKQYFPKLAPARLKCALLPLEVLKKFKDEVV